MEKKIKINATSETITFVKTTAETQGQFIEFIVTLDAGGKGPGPHIHPLQVETFEILEGKVGVLIGNDKVFLTPGQKLEIPAGTVHDFWPAENQNIKFKAVVTPALHFEWMLTEMFASCYRKGTAEPSIFDATYIMNKIKGEYILGDVPKFIQLQIFPIIALIGRLSGTLKVK